MEGIHIIIPQNREIPSHFMGKPAHPSFFPISCFFSRFSKIPAAMITAKIIIIGECIVAAVLIVWGVVAIRRRWKEEKAAK